MLTKRARISSRSGGFDLRLGLLAKGIEIEIDRLTEGNRRQPKITKGNRAQPHANRLNPTGICIGGP